MLTTFRNFDLRSINLRNLDIRKAAISSVVGLIGLVIVLQSLSGPTYFMNLVDAEHQLPYLKILMCSLGIFTMGLALIIFSISLMKKLIWGALAALLLVSFGLGCFALGTFIKCFLIAIVAFMAVAWEIGKFDLEY